MRWNYLFVAVALVLLYGGCGKKPTVVSECNTDSDCVPKTCCHANSCISLDQKPDCKGIMCTMECSPGTMDCSQGRCICQNNKCTAQIKGAATI